MKNLLKIALLLTLASGTMFAMDQSSTNNNNQMDLEQTILQDDPQKIQELINKNAFDNKPLLILALKNGWVNITKILLSNEINLISNLTSDKIENIIKNIESRTNFSEFQQRQLTCFKIALEKKQELDRIEISNLLLEQEKNLPLDFLEAIDRDDSLTIQSLIWAEQSLIWGGFNKDRVYNYKTKEVITPIKYAMNNGRINAVKTLLENEVDLSNLSIEFMNCYLNIEQKTLSNLDELEKNKLICFQMTLDKIKKLEISNKRTTKKAKIEKE